MTRASFALDSLAGAAGEPSLLVVAPHADDEVLGAGGLMARAARAGWAVHVAYATISGFVSPASGSASSLSQRQREVEDAARVLGVRGWRALFLGEEKHLRLDTVAQADLVSFVEGEILRLRPRAVVMPCRGHYHQDHRAVSDACIAAMRPAPDGRRPLVPLVLAYGHSAAGWGGAAFAFQPNAFFDVSEVIDAKLDALAQYRSQLCEPPHPRSLGAVREQCAAWGAYAGVAYAEPFECQRLLLS